MIILAALLTLTTAYTLACAAQALRTYGIAGCADLLGARLISFAEAWRKGRSVYSAAMDANVQWASKRREENAI